MPSDYRLSRPLAARLLGVLLAALGVLVVLLTIATGLLDLPGGVLGAVVLVVAVLVAAAAIGLSRAVTVVRLGDSGYRVKWVRGVGVAQGRWTDVEDVVATTVAGERCVVLRLKDGRTTTIPVRMLAESPGVFVKDLQTHLNTGHGYRRIN